MSYLSTLAARALDQPQPIRPRLPSLFEPAAGPRVNFREVTVNKRNKQEPRNPHRDVDRTIASNDSKSRTSSIRPKEVSTSNEAISPKVAGGSHSIKSFSESVQTSSEPKHVDERTADRISEKRTIGTANEEAADHPRVAAATSSAGKAIKPHVKIAQAITLEQTNVIETSRDAFPQAETGETKSQQPDESRPQSIVVKPEQIRPQSIVVKPEITTNASESTFVEPQVVNLDLSPSVKITIGRVDVRAIMPSAQSTVTVARQPAMKALSLDDYLKQRNGEHR